RQGHLVGTVTGSAQPRIEPGNPNRTALNSPRLTRSPRRLLFAERALRNVWPGSRGSLRLDFGRPDHLGLGFLGAQLAEVAGRARKPRAAEVGKPRCSLP